MYILTKRLLTNRQSLKLEFISCWDTGFNFLKSKTCWDSSGVNFKMLFDLILELQFAVTSVLQPSMAVEPDKNHESREELGRPGNLVKS